MDTERSVVVAAVSPRAETWNAWPVSWTAIWVGALAALATGLLIGLIGTAVGALVPKGGVLVGPILTILLQEVNASPKPEEICEGVLIGANVVEWLSSGIVR